MPEPSSADIRGGAAESPGGGHRSAPTRSIHLPEELVRALEARMHGSSFDSVEALITFILGRVVERPADGAAFSEEDERLLRERLRSLGYID